MIKLRKVNLGGGGLVRYFYDASSLRVQKVHEHGALMEERGAADSLVLRGIGRRSTDHFIRGIHAVRQ